MSRTAVVLLLALGVSANVPHWAQKKSAFTMPSIESIMAPTLSIQNRLAKQTPNSRHLQAILSEECEAACPGVQDMVKFMMEMATQSTTKAPEGTNPEVAAMMAMCDYADAIVCAGTNKACMDEGAAESGDDPAMLKCLCACPKVAEMGEGAEGMCKDKASTVGCLTSTSSCDSIVKSMGGQANADITCKMYDAGCEEKGAKMADCSGMETMTTFGGECSQAAKELKLAAKKDTCCPALAKVQGCYTKTCIDLGFASTKVRADMGDADAKKDIESNYQWGTVCTDSGLATSDADVQATIDGTSSDSTAATADFATPAQAMPVLTMAMAMVAFIA